MKCFLVTALLLAIAGCATDQSRRDQYLQVNPQTEPRISAAITEGSIVIGMTKEEVIASWGYPCGRCYGTRESSAGDWWEYNPFGSSSYGIGAGTHLRFDNSGRLKYWSK